MDDHVDELIPAHVLGALDAEESLRVEHHVAECPGCMAQLRDAEQATALLALSVPTIAPPPELRERLLGALEPQPAPPADPVPAPVPAAREPRESARSQGWWPRFARIAAPVLAVAVIGLVVWNVSLRNSLSDTQNVVYNSATSAALPQIGTVFVDADGHATLVANVAAAPSGKTYQAWVIPQGGKPISAGLFGGGKTQLDFATQAHPGDTVAVTVEPEGGSPQPTAAPVSESRVA